MAISRKQTAMLHVARAQLGMQDADYRQLLQHVAGVTSSRDLDDAAFDLVLAALERLGFQPSGASNRGRRGPGKAGTKATSAQLGKMRGLWQAFSGNSDDLSLGRWLEKHLHVSHLSFLDRWQAGKAIAILGGMVDWKARRSSAANGARRAKAMIANNAKRVELLPTDAAIRFYRLPDGYDAMYTVAEERDRLHARAWRAAIDQGTRPADIVRAEMETSKELFFS